jgi:hypothetical protein
MFTGWRTNGDSRATSTSRTSKPSVLRSMLNCCGAQLEITRAARTRVLRHQWCSKGEATGGGSARQMCSGGLMRAQGMALSALASLQAERPVMVCVTVPSWVSRALVRNVTNFACVGASRGCASRAPFSGPPDSSGGDDDMGTTACPAVGRGAFDRAIELDHRQEIVGAVGGLGGIEAPFGLCGGRIGSLAPARNNVSLCAASSTVWGGSLKVW